VSFAQFELIADPYTFPILIGYMMAEINRTCLRCKKSIKEEELHKIVMYVVQEKFTEHHYEHVECPEKFTI